MFHPLDEARRARAEADRFDFLLRSCPPDGHHAAAWLGLILTQTLAGWRPPWRRPARPRIPAALVLSLSRRAPVHKLFPSKPFRPEPAND